ncbi:hypothetical protein [Sphingomonas sp. Leaf357]|nr:hypothetical protein [Sphingomonas sp. Leaf357]
MGEVLDLLRHALAMLDAQQEHIAGAHVAHAIALLERGGEDFPPRIH